MTGILVAGTSSDAGKSLVVTALCRAAVRQGIDVVPFKAQNMSNNSMVCADGSEIARSCASPSGRTASTAAERAAASSTALRQGSPSRNGSPPGP